MQELLQGNPIPSGLTKVLGVERITRVGSLQSVYALYNTYTLVTIRINYIDPYLAARTRGAQAHDPVDVMNETR